MKVPLFLFLFLLPALFLPVKSWAAPLAPLPPEVKAYFEALPEKSLTLPQVLKAAMKSSTSYKGLGAGLPLIDIPKIKALIPLETQTYLKAGASWDQRESISPLTPPEQNVGKVAAGINQYFLTGTLMNAEIGYNIYDLSAARFAPAISSYESTASLQVAQNLWKDAFGKTTRKLQENAQQESQVQHLATLESFEDWFLAIAGIYYRAWLEQHQAKASLEKVQRRNRLLHISRVKSARGTAETQDVLQVESSLVNAEIQEMESANSLAQSWRQLVITLQLPAALLDIDARSIPLSLDNSWEDVESLCHSREKQNPGASTLLQKLVLKKSVSQQKEELAKEALAPSLQAGLGLQVNGTDGRPLAPWSESLLMKNPNIVASVNLTWPLDMHAEKAALQGAVAERMRDHYQWQSSQDLFEVDWTNGCKDFERLKAARNNYQNIVKKQGQREQLEEELFRMGRSNTMQVIQAGDDLTLSKLQLGQTETELRLSAWKVRRLAGKILTWPSQFGMTPFAETEVHP